MTILVTGTTGNVGRLVVDHLVAAGAKVRALTNNPTKAALPQDVEVFEGSLAKPSTLPAALAGVEQVYLAPLPRTARDAVFLAQAAGVQRIVALSSSNAEYEAENDPSTWHYYAVEHAVEASGLDWCMLRPGEFMSNALIWAEQIRNTGVVRSGYGDAMSTLIDLDDIAAIAARALLDDRHTGQKHLLSGPEAISRRAMVHAIGAALGRDIPFVELKHAQAVAELQPLMGEYAEWYIDGLATLAAHPPTPDRTRPEFTGEPATTFVQWARANVAEFRA